MIRIVCESCGAKFQVPDSVGGRATHCTKCKAVIKIPSAPQSGSDTGSFPAPQASSPARPAETPPPVAPTKAPASPAKAASPTPAPAANSAADALAALSAAISSPARKPASPSPVPPPPAAPPAAQPSAPAVRVAPVPSTPAAPAATVVPEPAPVAVEVPTRAYVVPDDLPQKSFDEEPPRKSHALLITVIVIAAVVLTLLGGGGYYVLVKMPEGEKKKIEASDIRSIQADVAAAEETMTGAPDFSKVENPSPASLDDIRQKLVTAKTKHDEIVHKMQLMNMQGDKSKELLAKLQGNLEKITQNLKLVDDAYWPGPGTPKEMFDRVRPSVPQIIIPGPGGQGFVSSGSGFLLVSQGKWCVATNRHVITDAENGVKIIFRVGPMDKLTEIEIAAPADAITRIHRATDLAIIDLTDKDMEELKKNNIRPLPINPNPDTTENPAANPQDKPSNGDPCWLVGHPGGDSSAGGQGIQINTFGEGSISNVIDMSMFCECLEISAPINPGNSGGPLFNKYGRVIGQVTFYRKDADRQNYAVSVNILRGLVENKSGNTWSWPKEEIRRILAPNKMLKEDYSASFKEWASQGYIQVPLPGAPGGKYGVNTFVDNIPFTVTEDKPHKLMIITGKSAIFRVALFSATQPNMPLKVVQKDKCVELGIDVPAAKGNYVLQLYNEYQNLKNPYIVALFKKK